MNIHKMSMISSIVSVLILIAVSASAQDSLNVQKVGELYDYWQYALDVDEKDGYSYLATIDGLHIYEATSSESMSKVGVYGYKSYQTIEIADDYAYVISQENSIQGNFAFIKMEILDLSVPESPVMLNTVTIESLCELGANGSEIKVWLVGENVFYSSVSGIIKRLDVSDPDDISMEIVSLENNRVINIAGVGDNIVVSSTSHIDVYDAENFNLIDHYEIGGLFNDVCVSGNYVYGVKQQDPTILHIYDVSVPNCTVEIANYDLLHRTYDIDVINNIIFGVIKDAIGENPDYLRLVDITDPYNPIAMNDIQIGNFSVVSFKSISSSESIISLVGFNIINLGHGQSYSRNAFLRCNIANLENPVGLAMVESDLFSGFKELQVIDNITYYKRKTKYYMIEDYCDQWDLVITDISNSSDPVELASLLYIEEHDFVVDNILYRKNYEGQIRAIDLSNPNDPEDLYVYSHDLFEYYYYGMRIIDNYLLLTTTISTENNLLGLFDISNRREEPRFLGSLENLEVSTRIVGLSENNLTLLGQNKLYIIDISNPEIPQMAAESELETGNIHDASVYGDFLFISETHGYNNQWGIKVFDISNANHPVEIDHLLFGAKVDDIEIDGDRLYITNGRVGLRIFDITDPHDIVETGYYQAGSLGSSVAVKDNMVYTVGRRLSIYDCTEALGAEEKVVSDIPEEYHLLKSYPNPFNPTLNIKVSLPEKGELRLSVFNVLGQEVAVLADQVYSTGIHNFTFNGSEMSSGVYFVKAVVEGKMNEVQKVMLMK